MKVLYILGRGRSGSTILANVLGEVDGFFSAGELRTLWDPVVARRAACGCGRPIFECDVWSRVLDHVSDIDVDQVVRWQHEIVRESNVPRLIRARRGRPWAALDGYAEVTSRLYRAIQEVTGCTVIIDSSKRPSYAAFIRLLAGCDPYFVHLARDPRASAYSWASRRYESVHGDEVKRRKAFDATVRWDMLNIGSEAVLRKVPRDHRLRLRYEDFARAPQTAVRQILALVGEAESRLPFLDERTVVLYRNHTIAGNPSRFRTGPLVLEDKAEWRTQQDLFSRWVATAVALPFLRRYGYSLRG